MELTNSNDVSSNTELAKQAFHQAKILKDILWIVHYLQIDDSYTKDKTKVALTKVALCTISEEHLLNFEEFKIKYFIDSEGYNSQEVIWQAQALNYLFDILHYLSSTTNFQKDVVISVLLELVYECLSNFERFRGYWQENIIEAETKTTENVMEQTKRLEELLRLNIIKKQ